MMKQLLIIVFLLLDISIKAQIVYIPDTNFKNALLNHGPKIDTNNDGEISFAEAEAFTGSMFVNSKNISDLTGIEAFINLTQLHCNVNQLTNLDLSNNSALGYLGCENNQLTSLNISGATALVSVFIGSNQLTSLDVSKNTALKFLHCFSNKLTSLDVKNNASLQVLWCYGNQLTSIDVTNNTALDALNCYLNDLTSLDVSNNTDLRYLGCENNQLTSLDVSNNTSLVWLNCVGNQLTSLDVSKNIALKWLYCNNNQFTSLDFSNNKDLERLNCEGNQLTSLDISNGNNSNLRSLNFINNPDLSCVTVDNQTQSRNWPKKQDVWYTDNDTNITYYNFDWDDHVVFSEDCSALANEDITNTTFEVYPNPATNFITINSTLESNYNLVSILGKTIAKGTLRQGDNTIDLSDVNKGIYLLNVLSDSYSKTIKIVKE